MIPDNLLPVLHGAVHAPDFALFPDMGDRLMIDPFWKKQS